MAANGRKNMNAAEQTEDANILPSEFSEVLRGVPEEKKQELIRVFETQFSMVRQISPDVEVAKKISGEHITTMLNNQDKAMELHYKEQGQKKVFYVIIVLVVLIAVFGIITLLKDTPDTMERILTVIVTAVITGFGGYGIGYKKGSDD